MAAGAVWIRRHRVRWRRDGDWSARCGKRRKMVAEVMAWMVLAAVDGVTGEFGAKERYAERRCLGLLGGNKGSVGFIIAATGKGTKLGSYQEKSRRLQAEKNQVPYGHSNEWFFYTTSAATGNNDVIKTRDGCYYEVTGEREVHDKHRTLVGFVRRLEFFCADGTKTDWVVHEFRLPDGEETAAVDDDKKKVVVCRIRFGQPESSSSSTEEDDPE
ncbi:hypothetical protein Tsubulata_004084 [Turnera subulata]|uniref:NAC domain-containing protein n=1 Tax=Turnera subulata TaxID=218843 RepID=A0A9Q0F7M7_9ROSI|nr:hypothetical protein Tsubulata_004084 [Turnera subulata]